MSTRRTCEKCKRPVALDEDDLYRRPHDDATCTATCWCRAFCWGDNTHQWERRNAPGTGDRPGLMYKVIRSIDGKGKPPHGFKSLMGVFWHFADRRTGKPTWTEEMRGLEVVEYEVREIGRRPLSALIPEPPSPAPKPKAEPKPKPDPASTSRWSWIEIE